MILKEVAFSLSTKSSLARVAAGAPQNGKIEMVKIEVIEGERRTQERVAVGLKVVSNIARTGVHIDDVKMAGTYRDLDTHNFITRRRRKVWKVGRGK